MSTVFSRLNGRMKQVFTSALGAEDSASIDSLYYLFLWALFTVLIVFVIALGIAASGTDAGYFGDFFGGIVTPLLTFATFMGLLITIVLQQTELRETRKELGRSAQALEQQLSAISRQSFEATFFQMLSLHNEIVESINITIKYHFPGSVGQRDPDVTVGRTCFIKFFHQYKSAYEASVAASARDKMQETYDKFWDLHQQKLAHYYRYMYNVFRYIYESRVDFDKMPYARLMRAQLSDYELVMLFYTALNRNGAKYALYIDEYQLFDNLPIDLLIDENHRFLYSDRSFGMATESIDPPWPPKIFVENMKKPPAE